MPARGVIPFPAPVGVMRDDAPSGGAGYPVPGVVRRGPVVTGPATRSTGAPPARRASGSVAQRLLIALVLVLNAQILAGTGLNPWGIRGAQEAFYGLLILWSGAELARQQRMRGRVAGLDLAVLGLVIGLAGYNATAALIVYGQPLWLGLIEERRILAVLIYFPVMTALRCHWISIARLERTLIGTAVLAALLTLGVWAGVLPALQTTATAPGTRLAIGQGMMMVVFPLLVLPRGDIAALARVLALVLLAGVLVVIVQSRQILFAALAGALYAARGPRAVAALVTAGLLLALAVALIPGAREIALSYQDRLVIVLSDSYLTESWRALAIADVRAALGAGALLGHGGLSPQFDGGFATVMGPYFFLADIGLFGTAFRSGLIGLVVYAGYIALQIRLIRRIADRRRRLMCGAMFVVVLAALPVAAPLEYRGFVSGLILAISAWRPERAVT